MSIKDELDRALQEKNTEFLRLLGEQQRKQELLKGMLDAVFSTLSVNFQKQYDPLISLILSYDIVNSLKELRDECNLIYSGMTPAKIDLWSPSSPQGQKRYVNPQVDKWYSQHHRVCSKLGDDDSFTKFIGLSGMGHFEDLRELTLVDWFTLESPETFSDIKLTLADHSRLHCYRLWLDLISRLVKTDLDFVNVQKAFKQLLSYIVSPPTQNFLVVLTWDYQHTYDGDGSYTTSFEEIIINVNFSEIVVNRSGGLSFSTPTGNCTAAWVKQQIASVFVKFPGS